MLDSWLLDARRTAKRIKEIDEIIDASDDFGRVVATLELHRRLRSDAGICIDLAEYRNKHRVVSQDQPGASPGDLKKAA